MESAAEESFPEEGGISANLSAVGVNSSIINQISRAAGITSINADGEVVTQPIVNANGHAAGIEVVTVRVIIFIADVDEVACSRHKHTPAIFRTRDKGGGDIL